MRRHTKLFEEFLEPKEQKRYWVVHDYSPREIVWKRQNKSKKLFGI